MGKAAKNLYLDPDAIEHAERYGREHGTNLSRLVSDFLRSLPLRSSSDLTPPVRRLAGAGVPRNTKGTRASVEDYREYLAGKYGRR